MTIEAARGFAICNRCRVPRDIIHGIPCCLCPKPCRLAICWSCQWMRWIGPCARWLGREISTSTCLASYRTSPHY